MNNDKKYGIFSDIKMSQKTADIIIAVLIAVLITVFINGKCTICNKPDPNQKITPLGNKKGVWSAKYISNEKYYSVGLALVGDLSIGVSIGDPLYKIEQEIQDDIRKHEDEEGYKDCYLVYNEKKYWCARGSFSPLTPISEDNDIVTLTSSEDSAAKIILTRTGENSLTVKSCTQMFKDMIEDIPAGTVLTFKAE